MCARILIYEINQGFGLGFEKNIWIDTVKCKQQEFCKRMSHMNLDALWNRDSVQLKIA